ncbi:hypothetical protein [Pseudomonas sp. Marseille-Q7302]
MLIAALLYTIYWAYQLYQYEKIPINKKDVILRETIKSRFPKNYDIEIINADLLGLGENFIVAYGNESFLNTAFALDSEAIKNIKKNSGKTNIPILKIFYISEPGPLESIISISPLNNVKDSIIELSVKEYKNITLLPTVNGKAHNKIDEYLKTHEFPQIFMISNVYIDDIDEDKKDEIIIDYLSYAGGSGGTKWSIIAEIIDGEIKISSGYPQMLNIDSAKFAQAVALYSGIDGTRPRDEKNLKLTLEKEKSLGNISIEQKIVLLREIKNSNLFIENLFSASQQIKMQTDPFFELQSGVEYKLYSRHTDDYKTFINIDSKRIFVEGFYVSDSKCHWCGHHWRIMAFYYDNGRWISDRNINGNTFNGQWLENAKEFDLNEIFGTYEDQGPTGLAWSFINKNWNSSGKENSDDPLGIGMRTTSPIDRQVRKTYQTQ